MLRGPISIAGKPPLPLRGAFHLDGMAFTEPLRPTRLKRRRTGSANKSCLPSGSTCSPAGPMCTRTSRVKEFAPVSRARTCAYRAPRATPSIRARWGPSSRPLRPFIRAAAACSWRYPWRASADAGARTRARARASTESGERARARVGEIYIIYLLYNLWYCASCLTLFLPAPPCFARPWLQRPSTCLWSA